MILWINSIMSYLDKYYKYKKLYLELRNKKGGGVEKEPEPRIVRIFNRYIKDKNYLVSCYDDSLADLSEYFDKLNIICHPDKYKNLKREIQQKGGYIKFLKSDNYNKLKKLDQNIIYTSSKNPKFDSKMVNDLKDFTKVFVLNVPDDYDFDRFAKGVNSIGTDVYKKKTEDSYFICISKN